MKRGNTKFDRPRTMIDQTFGGWGSFKHVAVSAALPQVFVSILDAGLLGTEMHRVTDLFCASDPEPLVALLFPLRS